jgi:hypothetical protein
MPRVRPGRPLLLALALSLNDRSELPAEPVVTPGASPCGSVPIQDPPAFPVLAEGCVRRAMTLADATPGFLGTLQVEPCAGERLPPRIAADRWPSMPNRGPRARRCVRRPAHAYAMDYGAIARAYIDAFFQNVQWNEVNRRAEQARARR